MFQTYGINNIILWIGNLFAAGALFLYFSKKNFSKKIFPWKKGQSSAAKKQACPQFLANGWNLRFTARE